MLEEQKAPVVGDTSEKGEGGDNVGKIIRHQKQRDLKDIGRISYLLLSVI